MGQTNWRNLVASKPLGWSSPGALTLSRIRGNDEMSIDLETARANQEIVNVLTFGALLGLFLIACVVGWVTNAITTWIRSR